MHASPRVGLVLMRSDWRGCWKAKETTQEVHNDANAIVERLRRQFTTIGPWIIDSLAALRECQHTLSEANVDMIVLAFQSWTDDTDLIQLLDAVGSRPLVLWNYLPWRHMPRPAAYGEVLRSSGTVSAFSALGSLRNLNVPFLFTWGAPDDPRLLRDLEVASRAAHVRQELHSARFGILPYQQLDMQATLVDESRLLHDFGPEITPVSVEEYWQASQSLPQAQVDAYLKKARQKFEIDHVSDAELEKAARAALGLTRVAEENRLDVLAVNDHSQALMRKFSLRPALYPFLGEEEVQQKLLLFQPEADLGAATANYILRRLTDGPTMFLEFWYWDEAMNQITGGHAGLQNPQVGAPGQVWISRDYNYCDGDEDHGAQLQMIARPGRVTLFQLRSTPNGWQAIAASGVCLETLPVVEGFPHAVVRLDSGIDHFLNQLAEIGTTQHWVMGYGSVLHELEAFCQMEKISLEVFQY